ncbi:MAG: lysophospholipid acyltransferase family protein [Pseudomonadota bacterium]
MIRSVIFLAYMFTVSIILGLIAFPALLKREWSIAFSKLWARTVLAGLTVLCGIRDRVIGAEHIPNGPALIAAKHQSMWETLRLTILLPRPSFVLKKELKHWPIFSWYCRANGFIFIDRDAGVRSLRDMTNQARSRLDEGAQIVIFPEGTRSKPGERLPYQPGVAALAKSLGVPTIPIAHDSGRYWKQPGPDKAPGTIILQVFEPMTDFSNRKTFLRDLEATIEGASETVTV